MMKKLLYRLILLALTLLTQQAYAQDKNISGTITDELGKPMEFVAVVVKGTSNGTISGADGSFSLKIPQNAATLVCSFVGYASLEVNADSPSPIIVKMQTVGNLDELVVVGYGTQSRQKVSSSIAKLDQDVLANTPRANIGSALQGTLPGLQVVNASGSPGATPLILLRGGASINNPGAPLVVVDGIIRAFNDISSEDIASIELLKDAASTAIYGARANNGVILITTKQGKVGTSQISYKYTNGLNRERPGYGYLNAKDFITYTRQGNLNSQISAAAVETRRGFGLFTDTANLSSFDIRRYTAANANLLSSGWDTVADPYGGGAIIFKDHGGEIRDILFRDTRTQDHYLNVMGGNEKGKYFASFDYYKEDGVIIGSDYKRFSGDVNGSYRIKPNVEVSTGAMFSTSSQLGTLGSEVNTIYRNLNIWPTFNPWIDAAKTIPNPGNGNTDGNPLYWLSKTDRRNEVNRITANASVKWDIVPGLFVKGTAMGYLVEGIDESFTRATQLYNNIFASPQTFSNTSRPSSSSFGRSFQQQYNVIANYTKDFNKHHTELMVGAEYYGTKAYDLQVSGTLAPTDDIATVNAATTFAAGSNFSTKSEYRIASTFGRFNYDFDDRFLLTLVFRRDGVSSLSEANRFGLFPGMSAGWNIHKEPFFQNSKLVNIISTFKPRVSYGQNGNVAGLGRYEVQGSYGSAGLYNGAATFLNTGIINNNLRWEKSKTTDVGLDLGLLKNKVTFLFDYYDRITSDLLTNLALPSYTGFNSLRTNLGTYQNKGYEMAVNANVFNKPNGLKIDIGANASFVKNKIIQLPNNGNENNRQGGLQIFDPVSGKVIWVGGLQEGQTLGDIYAFKQNSIVKNTAELETLANRWDAIALIGGANRPGTNKIALGDVNWSDFDKNDTIDSRDQTYIGNIFPKWTGGFSLSASYKGFSLYSRFEFAVGHTIYNDFVARTMGNYQGTFNYIDLMKQSWSPTNTESDIPRVYFADQVAAPNGKKNYTRINNANANLNSNNSRFYEKGDYLASREITFSYDFPKSLLAKTKYVSQLRIYMSGNNLAYLTKFTGPTPEAPISGGAITGIYGGAYPIPKSYVMGVQVSF